MVLSHRAVLYGMRNLTSGMSAIHRFSKYGTHLSIRKQEKLPEGKKSTPLKIYVTFVIRTKQLFEIFYK
jgi:hypothetical protein